MRCSELVEEISHFSFLLARHAHAHVFVGASSPSLVS